MSDFKDFDIEMYDDSTSQNQAANGNARSSTLSCVLFSAALSWATVSVSTNTTGTSMPCATMTNITE